MTALTFAACGGDDVPGSDIDAPTPPALLPADSAAQVAVPADNGTAGISPLEPSGEAGAPPAPTSGAERPGDARPTSPEPTTSQAATSNDAAAILRRASAAYEDVRTMRASFVMNREIPALRQTITSRGTLYQQSPDRIALQFTDPDGDVILSDGQYFWVYYPSVNADQVIRSPAAAGSRSGVDLQAQFVGNPVDRFEATLHGTESVGGRQTNVLTLVPRQRAEYRSLKVWLDTRDSLARRFEIVEHNGSMRRFDLNDLRTNVTIPASTFQFTPPPGARIITPD